METAEKIWLKPLMLDVCKRVAPKSILEIGFGLGITADTFQEYGVEKHIIIEPHPVIAERARKWAEGKDGVTIIEDFVQNVEITERVDLIYDDRYEMVHEEPDYRKLNSEWLAKWSGDNTRDTIVSPDNMGFEYERNKQKYFQFLMKRADYIKYLEKNGSSS